jgi:hypothetical protein
MLSWIDFSLFITTNWALRRATAISLKSASVRTFGALWPTADVVKFGVFQDVCW